MKEAILKYGLDVAGEQEVWMHRGAKLLTMQMQRGVPCIWVRCDQSQELCQRSVLIYVTETACEIEGEYVGTFQAGDFVGHVFMLPEASP